MTLNSKNYRNYLCSYSNLTQEHFYKTIQEDKEPLIKKKNHLSIKLEPLQVKDTKKENTSFATETPSNLFLTRIKETKEGLKFREKIFGATKNGFNKINLDKIIKTEKDFKELCEKNIFESKFLKKFGIKKIDMDNCYEEKQKNFYHFEKSLMNEFWEGWDENRRNYCKVRNSKRHFLKILKLMIFVKFYYRVLYFDHFWCFY